MRILVFGEDFFEPQRETKGNKGNAELKYDSSLQEAKISDTLSVSFVTSVVQKNAWRFRFCSAVGLVVGLNEFAMQFEINRLHRDIELFCKRRI